MPIVTDGLTSHWDFKDGAGTVITDVVGTSDGVLSGTLGAFWAQVDRNGDAVGQFDGTTHRVVTGITALPNPFSLSVLFWVDRIGFDSTGHLLTFYSPNHGFRVLSDTGGLKLIVGTAAGDVTIATRALTECVQHWMVVTVVRNGTAWDFYVSKLKSSGTATPGTAPSALRFGANAGATSFAKGRMGDALWYNAKALTTPEVEQNVDGLLERIRGTITVDTSDPSHSKTVVTLPTVGATDNSPSHVQRPLVTSANKIYAAEFVSVDASNGQANFYRFDKSWNLEETATPYIAQGEDGSHRSPGIGVDVNGKPLVQSGTHNEQWNVRRADAADDLDPSTAVTDPYAVSTEELTYPHFYRSPSTGKAYFGARQNVGGSTTHREWDWWEDNGTTFSRLGGIAHYSLAGQAAYWGTLFEGPDAKLYSITTWHDGGAGGPYHHLSALYSADAGTTWKRLTDDATVTLPATYKTADAVIPRTLPPTAAEDITDHDFTGPTTTPAVTSDGRVHWTVAWSNQLEGDSATLRSLWYVRWNPTGKYFEHYRLLEEDGVDDAGVGFIVTNPADDSLHMFVSGRIAAAFNVYLYSSFDQGDTWERRILHDQSVEEVARGSAPDNEGIRIDNLWRMRVLYDVDTTKAEVWEFSLPSGGVTGTSTVTQDDQTSTASGTVGTPAVTGTSAVTQENNIATASGIVGEPSFTGTLDATQENQTSTASGFVVNTGIGGALAVTQGTQVLAASGLVTAAAITGTLAVTQEDQVLVAQTLSPTFWEPDPVAYTPVKRGDTPPW